MRISEKIAIAELRSCGCGATFFKKLRNCDCGSASFKLRSCDCGLKKKLRVPTSTYTSETYDNYQKVLTIVIKVCQLSEMLDICRKSATFVGKHKIIRKNPTLVGKVRLLSEKSIQSVVRILRQCRKLSTKNFAT